MIMHNKRLIIILFISTIILLIPFILMQFTDEVNWTISDFILAGGLLYGTGLLLELAIRKIKNVRYRIAIIAAHLIFLILIWAELAVGVFGTAFNGH